MKKKILFFAIVFIIFNIKSYADSSGLEYKLNASNQATITAYRGTEGNITIPSTIDGYTVTTIDQHAFDESRNNTNGKILKNVIISEGITKIGDYAFVDCDNLESVTLPESLINLGNMTFLHCSNLKKINIPSQITNFGYLGSMFQETGFSEFIIPENVKKVAGSTFRSCKKLKKVIVYSDDIEYEKTFFGVFDNCPEDMILYGNEGSTTQKYAQELGIQFREISNQNENLIESITLNKEDLSLYIGETEKLLVTILPGSATEETLNWSSSDSKIVTVENRKSNS